LIDPKPEKRIKMSRDEWKELRSRILKYCAICGREIDGITGSVHHLLKRSQGGDDVPENLVPLCGHGTSGCHGDIEARRQPALSRLRHTLTSSQIEYLARKKDDDWINRNLPHLPETIA
jgi:hypothetical protein